MDKFAVGDRIRLKRGIDTKPHWGAIGQWGCEGWTGKVVEVSPLSPEWPYRILYDNGQTWWCRKGDAEFIGEESEILMPDTRSYLETITGGVGK